MTGEMSLVRAQNNELADAERKIDGQIARAKKGQRTGRRIMGGACGVMLASLAGVVLVPHIALGIYAVAVLGVIGGAVKEHVSAGRVSKEQWRRKEIDARREGIERNRLLRLHAATTAALETERGAGTLAIGREVRVDFEDETPKILRIDEMGSTFSSSEEDRQPRLRIAAGLYEAEAGADGGLKRHSGSKLFTVIRNFEPMGETMLPSPQPAEPEKKLPTGAQQFGSSSARRTTGPA